MREERDINERVAARVRELRASARLSLDALASKSGVSRSMISVIERGASSPTAAVLGKLAAALNVTLASLFDAPKSARQLPASPVARRKEQVEWQDPESGYLRRSVSPQGVWQPMRISEVHFPSGGRVSIDAFERHLRAHQQIWVLEGSMEITVNKERYQLWEGDCLAMRLEGPVTFHNPGKKPARYVVVNSNETTSRR